MARVFSSTRLRQNVNQLFSDHCQDKYAKIFYRRSPKNTPIMTITQHVETLKVQARRQLTQQGMKVMSMGLVEGTLHIHYKDRDGEIRLQLLTLPI
jgi:hypothetical protein